VEVIFARQGNPSVWHLVFPINVFSTTWTKNALWQLRPERRTGQGSLRISAEAAAATSAPGVTPVFVFVKRGGSASAATAVSGIVGKLECELEARIGKVVHLAQHEASTAHQAELEVVETETVEIKKKLQVLKVKLSEREAEA